MPEENANHSQGPPPLSFITMDNEAKHACAQSWERNLCMRSGICMVSKLRCRWKTLSDPVVVVVVVGVGTNGGIHDRWSSRGNSGGDMHDSCTTNTICNHIVSVLLAFVAIATMRTNIYTIELWYVSDALRNHSLIFSRHRLVRIIPACLHKWRKLLWRRA